MFGVDELLGADRPGQGGPLAGGRPGLCLGLGAPAGSVDDLAGTGHPAAAQLAGVGVEAHSGPGGDGGRLAAALDRSSQ